MSRESDIEQAILNLLNRRKPGATICPSEAARVVDPEAWRGLMEATRSVAQQLTNEGRIEVCQKGEVIDLESVKGPIRLRLKTQS